VTCDKCGAKIIPIMTPDGRKISCDATPVHYKVDGNGKYLFLSIRGDALRGNLAVEGMDAKRGYMSHFATCEDRRKLKKGAEKGVQMRLSEI